MSADTDSTSGAATEPTTNRVDDIAKALEIRGGRVSDNVRDDLERLVEACAELTPDGWTHTDPCPECGSDRIEKLTVYDEAHRVVDEDRSFASSNGRVATPARWCFECEQPLEIHPVMAIPLHLGRDTPDRIDSPCYLAELDGVDDIDVGDALTDALGGIAVSSDWEEAERCPECGDAHFFTFAADIEHIDVSGGSIDYLGAGDRMATLKWECSACGVTPTCSAPLGLLPV